MMNPIENINLEYPIIVVRGADQYHAPKGCEVFLDEHNIQWVKFFPVNGYQRGKEHMVRTSEVMIVRDSDRERRVAQAE